MMPPQGPGPRIALAGSVSFSRVALQALVRNRACVAGVLGLAQSASANVSDYARLDDIAAANGIPYHDFININDPQVIEIARSWRPEILFVVGLSQLLREELMAVPSKGCVGFHPTPLPRGRGRAPVAWLTWDGTPGAATFFLIDQGIDSGPIFVQDPFPVERSSTSQEVVESVRAAIDRALDRWLPRLLTGEWNPRPQNETEASYFGKRGEKDGLIDWSRPAAEIDRLIRTAGRPYPGAYSYADDAKVLIWRAEPYTGAPHRGIIGRVLDVGSDGSLLVQTGDGLLRLREIEVRHEGAKPPRIAVGTQLGYSAEDEIHSLRRRIAALEQALAARTPKER